MLHHNMCLMCVRCVQLQKEIFHRKNRCFSFLTSLENGQVKTAINKKSDSAEKILTQIVLINLKFIEIAFALILVKPNSYFYLKSYTFLKLLMTIKC